MGFHVSCKGSAILMQLSEDADRFLGEPFALYMVALATSVDEDALEWLVKYEMALDSLTGPYAAFMLFYNEAHLRGEPYPPGFGYLRGKPRRDALTVDISPKVLRSGPWEVDQALRYDESAQTSAVSKK